MSQSSTSVTILTPPGRGAVASLSVEGPRATQLVDRCFAAASSKRLSAIPLSRIAFGRWQTVEGLGKDGLGEDLVVCRLTNDRIEVHCHGGVAAAEAIVASLVTVGAVRLSPQSWMVAHEPDRIAAEARLALAAAKTERTAMILLDQYRGALRREVEEIIAYIDHHDHLQGLLKLCQLSQRTQAGQHLINPCRIAITGPPNVGKSSLMNALVGYSRSIVFDQPGTTRDLVMAETAFDGWPMQLIDTAGLRQSDDAIESAGVERAQQAIMDSDLLLRVCDSLEFNCSQYEADSSIHLNRPEIAVLNKIDLRSDRDSSLWPGVKVSANTGEGLQNLIRAIIKSLIGIPPSPGNAVPFTTRQTEYIAQARRQAEVSDFASATASLQSLLG